MEANANIPAKQRTARLQDEHVTAEVMQRPEMAFQHLTIRMTGTSADDCEGMMMYKGIFKQSCEATALLIACQGEIVLPLLRHINQVSYRDALMESSKVTSLG